jgi:hypothetical protein
MAADDVDDLEALEPMARLLVSHFRQENAALRDQLAKNGELIQRLTEQVEALNRRLFGKRSEKIGQTVRVRASDKLVEVFTADGQRLAAHARLSGLGKFSTDEQHYPDGKLSIRRFEVRSAQAEADRIGPKLSELVQSLFASSHPLRHLRRVQGILRLHQSGRVSATAS